MKIYFIEKTNSTNDHILSIDEDMALVFCGEQLVGRGQRGNSWESEKGKNLTFSFMLKPKGVTADKQFVISKIVALAIVDMLSHYSIKASVKWPNDIYIGDKKIAGILIENKISSGGFLSKIICGVGLNINQTEFKSDAPNPISMANILGKEFDLEDVLQQFCNSFEELYMAHNIDDSTYIDNLYWDTIFRREENHSYIDNDGEFVGRIIGIGKWGELIVEKEQDKSIKSYLFKDVKYII